MSENATEDPPVMTFDEVVADLRPDQVIDLLGEYNRKLRQRVKLAEEIQESIRTKPRRTRGTVPDFNDPDEHKLNAIKKWFIRVRPPATDLARHASTMIEGVKLRRLMRLELRLRLAEFEADLERATEVILSETHSPHNKSTIPS